MKNINNIMKKRYIFLMIFLVLGLTFVFFFQTFYYSHLSVMTNCFPQSKILEGTYSVGTTSCNVTTKEIVINIYELDIKTFKHEWVHYKQAKQHRLFSCYLLPLKYLNEIEAYLMSNLNDKTFEFIYPGYINYYEKAIETQKETFQENNCKESRCSLEIRN